MTEISILDIIEKSSIGPIKVGMGLFELSQIFPPPEGWRFPYQGRTDGILSYGPLDIYMRTEAEVLSIYLAQVRLMKSVGRRITLNAKNGVSFYLTRPLKRERKIDFVRSYFDDRKIRYTLNSEKDIQSGAFPYMEFKKQARIYFAEEAGEFFMNYIELADYQ